ncbi:MAG: ABC transporter ATP-binding protein [Mailhella sp.]|nr:ABC transporter ATP-binding protein [Mailhella sp.]
MKLEIEHGWYAYPGMAEPVLRDVSLQLEDRSIVTILGKNGVGKTTLIKCLAGILKWDRGRTLYHGRPCSSVKDMDGVAFVPQAHPLAYAYAVRDMVLMGRVRHMGLLSIPSKKDRAVAEQTLEELGIANLAGKPCSQLSGGQLQLVYIARALAGMPDVLIMDEPESHLDFKNQHAILRIIRKLVEEKGLSCIINTHYPDHALRISHKTLLLGRERSLFGKTAGIVTEGNIREFFDVEARITHHRENGRDYAAFVVIDS